MVRRTIWRFLPGPDRIRSEFPCPPHIFDLNCAMGSKNSDLTKALAHDWITAAKNMGNGTLESEKEHKSLRVRGDARINENLTAVTDDRQPPRGPPIEGLYLLVWVVDCLRGGSPAKPSGVRLCFLCFPDSFLLCFVFFSLALF